MSEQAPKYDSTIQDLFVTDGEDIGRVKDKEFAHEVAKKYNDERNRELNLQAEGRTEVIPLTNEADTAGSNHILKHEVGRYAINNNDGIAQLERDIAGIGMGTSSILSGRQYVGRQSERLVDKLRRVKDGYNGLEDTAKKGGSNSA